MDREVVWWLGCPVQRSLLSAKLSMDVIRCGLALGYPDPSSKLCGMPTERLKLQEFCHTFSGFDTWQSINGYLTGHHVWDLRFCWLQVRTSDEAHSSLTVWGLDTTIEGLLVLELS